MKASSESGLWATVISRIVFWGLLMIFQQQGTRDIAPNVRPLSYIECCNLRADAAASMTLMISANKNGAKPKAKARCQLPVMICNQEIPAANNRISAATAAMTFRANDAVPRSEIKPATKATTG